MSKYRVVCEPKLKYKATHPIMAPSPKEAIIKAVLMRHYWLTSKNIGNIQHINQKRYIVEILRCEHNSPPSQPLDVAMAPTWFWIKCSVEKGQ